MDRSLLTRSPTDDEHLGSFVTTNAMTPVITFLKTEVRCEILFGMWTLESQELISSNSGGDVRLLSFRIRSANVSDLASMVVLRAFLQC
jgi:hypothetical protein